MTPHKYTYPARCTNVIDGDTIDVTLDLGLHLTSTQRVRLLGVNCPELHAADPEVRTAAINALDYTRTTIDEWQDNTTLKFPLLVTTTKTDAFGRWLADVESAMFHTDTLSNELLTAGHAVPYTRKQV